MVHFRIAAQPLLFDTSRSFDNGLVYKPDFITPDEEVELIQALSALPLTNATFREYTAKRRVANFGWGFDADTNLPVPGPPLPPFLHGLQKKIADWLQIDTSQVVEALVNEYQTGTPLGWHRDNERFEKIVGISLGNWCRIRFRPIDKLRSGTLTRADILNVELEPRSAYIMQDEVRWKWQHSIAATKGLRYSITLRTLKHPPRS